MQEIDFVDAHVHLIDIDHLHYPWLSPPFSHEAVLGSTEAIARSYTLQTYLKDMTGWRVRGIVHVDSGVAQDEILSEVRYVNNILTAACGSSDGTASLLEAAAIIGATRLESPDLPHVLAQHKTSPLFRGVRHIVNWHKDMPLAYPGPDMTVDPRWLRGLGVVAAHGLTLDLQCFPDQIFGLVPHLHRHETMPVVIDHLGMPLFDKENGLKLWRDGMRELAALPNMHVKLSGFGFVKRDWRYEDVAPVLTEVIDLFGVERCMFASDFPTDLLCAPARRTFDAWLRFLVPFSDNEKRALLGGVAARFYRLGLSF